MGPTFPCQITVTINKGKIVYQIDVISEGERREWLKVIDSGLRVKN